MFCKYCGKELKDDAEFCPYCGKKQTIDDTEENTDTNKNAFRAQNVSVNATETEKGHKTKAASFSDEGALSTKRSSSARGSSSNRGVLIAVGLVAVIAVVSIVGITRNIGSGTRGGNVSDNTLIAGEEETNNKQNDSLYRERIEVIMQDFEDFIANSNGGEIAQASYRMFELLCLMAEELDQSGTYATAKAESAMERYKDLDATLEYRNLQVANGLYRCAEMLGSILYEVEGEESVQWIKAVYAKSITEEVATPTVDNFLECQGETMYVIYEYLYRLVQNFDLPEENRKEIEADYSSWTEDMNTVQIEIDKAAYNYGHRQMIGSLYRVYQLLYQTASGLDSSSKYSDDIQSIKEDFDDTVKWWKEQLNSQPTMYIEEYDFDVESSMIDDSTRLLAIIVWQLS